MKRNRGGSAIGLVLIFLTAMLLIGSALLAISHFNLRGAAASALADRSYYAAESAAQLAVQLYAAELRKQGFPEIHYGMISSPAALSGFISGFDAGIREKLAGVFSAVSAGVDGRVYNEETVGTVLDIDLAVAGESYDVTGFNGAEACFAAAWIDRLELTVSARAGGRAVSASFGQRGGFVTDAVYTETVITGGDGEELAEPGGGWTEAFDEYNGFVLGPPPHPNPGELSYDQFSSALDALLGSAKTAAQSAAMSAASGLYTVAGGDLTLTGGNSPAAALTLDTEYLYVKGKLTLTGHINMPELKGVYIEGAGYPDDAVLLEIAGNSHITCNPARKNPPNGPIIGTSFVVGNAGSRARMTVGAGNEVYHCRFYVPYEITVRINSSGFLSNSVFLAYGPDGSIHLNPDLQTNTPFGSPADAPQFYAASYLGLGYRGNANSQFYGIYATAGHLQNTGGSSGNPTNGFFMGSALTDVNKGAGTVPLSQETKNRMIDIGSLFNVINPPREQTVMRPGTPSYRSEPVGLALRETTGD